MGSCKACGECCKWLTFHPSAFDYDTDHIQARGGRLVRGIVFFQFPCPQLAADGKCSIFNSRPRFCRPGREENYSAIRELGCRYGDEVLVQDDPSILKIHVKDVTGAAEFIR